MKSNVYLVSLVIGSLAFAAAAATAPQVEFVQGDKKIDVMVGGKLFTSYRYADELTKPVLYPVHTPSGIAVNRAYPFAKVEGESTDHPHHTGIFFTYDKVNEDGFWNNTTSPPQIKHVKVAKMKRGPGKGRLSTVMQWVGKSGKPLLEEKRNMIFHASESEYVIDFKISLKALDTKVTFGDTKEGMFAIRAADWLREKEGTGKYLSSNGDQTEKDVWGKRAKWVRLQGEKDGKTIGIAIFNHPKSVNYPTYWHARGYGLFSANPLGQFDFEKKRDPDGAKPLNFTLEPGKKANFRFRIIVYEGDRTPEQLEERFNAFVSPPSSNSPQQLSGAAVDQSRQWTYGRDICRPEGGHDRKPGIYLFLPRLEQCRSGQMCIKFACPDVLKPAREYQNQRRYRVYLKGNCYEQENDVDCCSFSCGWRCVGFFG